MVLTVQARKHAPDLKHVNVSRSMPPVEFRLEPARTIRGRLVDGEGNPVAGTFVAADTWRGCRSIEFRVNTGNDGRFEWNDAPERPGPLRHGRRGVHVGPEQVIGGQRRRRDDHLAPPAPRERRRR